MKFWKGVYFSFYCFWYIGGLNNLKVANYHFQDIATFILFSIILSIPAVLIVIKKCRSIRRYIKEGYMGNGNDA